MDEEPQKRLIGFYSQILADKVFKECPIWMTKDGEHVFATVVVGSDTPIGRDVPRFLKAYSEKYPDLVCVGEVVEVAKSGVKKKKAAIAKHCCLRMKENVERTCDQHENPYDCPDRLVVHWPDKDFYGLIVHDGGSSAVQIHFCPWCGTELKEKP